MIFKKINRLVPEQVYTSVVNTAAVTALAGHCVVWDYGTEDVTSAGYGVRYPGADTTNADNPAAFAGIVDADIPPYSKGLVQVWGLRNYVYVTGYTKTDYFVGATQAWSHSSMRNVVLRPVNVYDPGTAYAGLLGVMSLSVSLPGVFGFIGINTYQPGGYVIPMSRMYTSVSTDGSYLTGTLTTTQTGFCKVFIRAL